MVAYLDVPTTLSSKPSRNSILSYLKRHHIVYGIHNDRLEQIINGRIHGLKIPIAVGKSVKYALPGRYEFLVSPIESNSDGGNEKTNSPDSSYDQLIIVKKGTRLVKLIAPVAGVQGMTVKGEIVPIIEPEVTEISTGPGTKMENGYIIALIEGAVTFDGTVVSVRRVKTLQGDIEQNTGNFDYDGILRVTGSILQGVKLYVKGELYVGGNVEDAEVKCDASVVVDGEVVGKVGGVIECAGKLMVKRVSFFSLIAGQNIIIKEDSLHSTLVSDTAIVANRIVGGMANACTISVGSAGSKENVKTVLNITRAQQIERERYDLLKKFGALMSERTSGYETMYVLVKDGMDEEGYLKESQIATLGVLKEQTKMNHASSQSIQQRLGIIEISDLFRSKGAFIKVGLVYPGTMYQTISQEYTIVSEERNVLLSS